MNIARLSRIRGLQRRAADAAEAEANAAVARNRAQAQRLSTLADGMMIGAGVASGRTLGTACEFVMRLNAGLHAVEHDAALLSDNLQTAHDAAIAARRAERSVAMLAERHHREDSARVAKRDAALLPPRVKGRT